MRISSDDEIFTAMEARLNRLDREVVRLNGCVRNRIES